MIEQLRRRAQVQAERQEIAEATGIADEEVLQTLQELGYTQETIGLLHLVPLAQIAWASGSVTPQERKLVLQLSEWRGVEKDGPAWKQLNRWLDERPTDEFFLTTLRIIRHILDSDTGKPSVANRADLISFCPNRQGFRRISRGRQQGFRGRTGRARSDRRRADPEESRSGAAIGGSRLKAFSSPRDAQC